MSNEQRCALETINTANKVGNIPFPAVEIVKSASTTDTSEMSVISCGKCGVELSISTELGDENAQLKLYDQPSDLAEACMSAKYKKIGDWVTNLNRRWFSVQLLEPQGTESYESNQDRLFSVSSIGLETILNDAAQHTAKIRQMDSERGSIQSIDETTRIEIETATAISVLDRLLLRRDGRTWQEEVDERSKRIE